MSDFFLQANALQWQRDSAEPQSLPNWTEPQCYADWSIGIPSLAYLPNGSSDQPVKPKVLKAEGVVLQSVSDSTPTRCYVHFQRFN